MMLPDTTASLAGFCALAFVIGARHGLDADHLAVIDGVTRLNSAHRPRLSRAAGVLFSAGHCSVLVVAVLAASLLAARAHLPDWLELSGTLVSVLFLLALTALNIVSTFATPAHAIVQPLGMRARWFANAPLVARPFGVFATGMLFALSFDALSQALLFAVVGSRFAGALGALAVALCFTTGMLIVDGLNGLWVAKLIRAADRRAAITSRVMAFTVNLVSLSVCALVLSSSLWPAIEHWGDRNQLWLGAAIVALPTLAAVAALNLGRAHVSR